MKKKIKKIKDHSEQLEVVQVNILTQARGEEKVL